MRVVVALGGNARLRRGQAMTVDNQRENARVAVTAACDFATATGKPPAIGALADIDAMLAGTAGTRVLTGVTGVVFAPS